MVQKNLINKYTCFLIYLKNFELCYGIRKYIQTKLTQPFTFLTHVKFEIKLIFVQRNKYHAIIIKQKSLNSLTLITKNLYTIY